MGEATHAWTSKSTHTHYNNIHVHLSALINVNVKESLHFAISMLVFNSLSAILP